MICSARKRITDFGPKPKSVKKYWSVKVICAAAKEDDADGLEDDGEVKKEGKDT